MSKKLGFVLAIIYFFSSVGLVFASVIINEVEISPTENRFIELYNQTSSEIDLTGWYIQRKTQSGESFGSLVSKTNFENKKIKAGGYFLISRGELANADIVLSSLTLTESNSIQVKNANGEVVSVVCWGEVNQCSGLSAPNPGEGQSIQMSQNGTLTVGSPTPGMQNFSSSISASQPANVSSASYSVVASVESKPKTVEESKIKTEITSGLVGFVGVPISMQARAFGRGGEQLYSGKYFWNFGDADSKEVKLPEGGAVSHSYFYPGSYTVSLDYYQNHYSSTPDASDQIVIKIIKADVVISRVGDDRDFFIELSNNTDQDADVSGWIIASNQKKFVLPRHTVLGPKNPLIISPQVTQFTFSDRDTLKLFTPEYNMIFSYTPAVPTVAPVRHALLATSWEPSGKNIISDRKENEIVTEQVLGDEGIDITASAVSSGVLDNDKNRVVPIVFFGLFISAMSALVYFIRQKRVIYQAGNDFEILDE